MVRVARTMSNRPFPPARADAVERRHAPPFCDDATTLQHMLDFEAALARAPRGRDPA